MVLFSHFHGRVYKTKATSKPIHLSHLGYEICIPFHLDKRWQHVLSQDHSGSGLVMLSVFFEFLRMNTQFSDHTLTNEMKRAQMASESVSVRSILYKFYAYE